MRQRPTIDQNISAAPSLKPLLDCVSCVGDGGADVAAGRGGLDGDGFAGKVGTNLSLGVKIFDRFGDRLYAPFTHDGGNC